MFGPALNTVFSSRWRALWFAASMLLLAWCSVPRKEGEDSSASGADANSARAAIAGADLPPEEAARLQATVDSLQNLSSD